MNVQPAVPGARILSLGDYQPANVVTNADGTAVHRAGDVRDRLVRQLTQPVRWDLCQATLRDLGVTAIIELPPAGTLAGIARRELPGVETVRLRTPADLAAAQALVARTTAGSQGEHVFYRRAAPGSRTRATGTNVAARAL